MLNIQVLLLICHTILNFIVLRFFPKLKQVFSDNVILLHIGNHNIHWLSDNSCYQKLQYWTIARYKYSYLSDCLLNIPANHPGFRLHPWENELCTAPTRTLMKISVFFRLRTLTMRLARMSKRKYTVDLRDYPAKYFHIWKKNPGKLNRWSRKVCVFYGWKVPEIIQQHLTKCKNVYYYVWSLMYEWLCCFMLMCMMYSHHDICS